MQKECAVCKQLAIVSARISTDNQYVVAPLCQSCLTRISRKTKMRKEMNCMKIRNTMRILSLMLAVLLLFPSCSQTEIHSGEENGATSEGTVQEHNAEIEPAEEEPEGNGRSEVPDSLPPDLDFEGAEIRVFCRAGDRDTEMEFIADDMTGDVVNDAVFQRNAAVQDRLNVGMTVLPDISLNRHMGADVKIRTSVRAASDDYDLIANAMYSTMPLITENMFLPLNTLDYLDFSSPWYNPVFLEASGINGNVYAVMGDLAQSMISGSFVMFFNKTLLDEYFKGEINLYETVLEGRWTLDEMTSLCGQIYTDANGNSEADEGDVFGHFFTNTLTLGADSFYGGAKLSFFLKDEDGSYVYNGCSERMILFTEKMHKLLFENNNTLLTPDNGDQIMDSMIGRHAVFTTWMLGGIDYLREMEDDFGIIPMPKLDEAQDINTAYAHDGSSAFTIPVTEQNPAMIAAFLEAMSAESYRTVTPAYFETAIKVKYSRDSETAKMLDMVVSGIYLDFSYIFGQSLVTTGTPIDIVRKLLSGSTECENAASALAKVEKASNSNANRIMKQYMKLKGGE